MEYVLFSASSPLSCCTHLDPKPLLQLLKPSIFSNNIDKTKLAHISFFFFFFVIPREALFQQQYFSAEGEGGIGKHFPLATDTKNH